jgi:hypothetical protein
MGWDYELVLETADITINPEVLLKIVEAMLSSTAFSFDSIQIYNDELYNIHRGSMDKAIVAAFESKVVSPLPTLKVWLNQFNERGTQIDIVFTVKRLWGSDEFENYAVSLCFDNHFLAYPGQPPKQLIYNAHSSKIYSTHYYNSDYETNMALLLAELEVFIQAGVESIRGLHGYMESADIQTHLLSYHQNIANFISDLKQIEPNCPAIVNFDVNDFLAVVSEAEGISAKQVLQGLMVWSNRGMDGSLFKFYQALLAWCKAN